MNLFTRISLTIVAIATLQGCGETTFDADKPSDSFTSLYNDIGDDGKKNMFAQLWDVYSRGYIDENGQTVLPDYAKLNGKTVDDMIPLLKDHVDFVQFEGFMLADGDDGVADEYATSDPTVELEVYGTKIYLTALNDNITVKDVIVNRGNCRIESTKRGRKIPEDEVKRLIKAGSKIPVIRVRNYNNVSGFDFYEQAKPFPVTAKFGQEIVRSAEKGCNIIEVTVVEESGTWTWSFES